jgi:hypothetical protein
LQRKPGIFDPELLDRLMTWGQALRNLARRSSPGGIQMIRRDEAQSLAGHGKFTSDSMAVTAKRAKASIPQNAPQGP